MCGRYDLDQPDEIYDRFEIEDRRLLLEPNYNVAPSQIMPVVVQHSPNHLELMRWGLIPFYAKEPKGIINARAETVSTNAAFKKAFQLQRCLVPASGFYEWKKTSQGKVPYHIYLKDDRLFAFAGIYTIWKSSQGQELKTYAIITTEPNELMAEIHNRMPVILEPDNEAAWLNPDETEASRLLPLLTPYPAKLMQAVAISRAVNNPKNNFPELLKPV